VLLDLISDIERVHHRLHSGIGAPHRQPQAHHEGEAQLPGGTGIDNAQHLLMHDPVRPLRHEAREIGEMIADGRDIGEQRVARHQRGDAGKQREQRVEHHAGRHGEEPVFADAGKDPERDMLPERPAASRRRLGRAGLCRFIDAVLEDVTNGIRRGNGNLTPIRSIRFFRSPALRHALLTAAAPPGFGNRL